MKKVMSVLMSLVMMISLLAINGVALAETSETKNWTLSTALPSGVPTTTQGYFYYKVSIRNLSSDESSSLSKHISTCTTFSTTASNSGQRASVSYTVKITDSNGTVKATHYGNHFSRDTRTTTLASNLTYGRYGITEYSLSRPSTAITASISGNVKFSS